MNDALLLLLACTVACAGYALNLFVKRLQIEKVVLSKYNRRCLRMAACFMIIAIVDIDLLFDRGEGDSILNWAFLGIGIFLISTLVTEHFERKVKEKRVW